MTSGATTVAAAVLTVAALNHAIAWHLVVAARREGRRIRHGALILGVGSCIPVMSVSTVVAVRGTFLPALVLLPVAVVGLAAFLLAATAGDEPPDHDGGGGLDDAPDDGPDGIDWAAFDREREHWDARSPLGV